MEQNVVLYIYAREKESNSRVKVIGPVISSFFSVIFFCFLVPDQKRNGWIEKRTDGQVYIRKSNAGSSRISNVTYSQKKRVGGGGYYTTTDLAQSKNPEYGDVERIELSANSKKNPLKKVPGRK